VVTEDKWVHVTVSVQQHHLKIKIDGENEPLLQYEDKSEHPLHPEFLNVRNNVVPAYFRIQNCTYVNIIIWSFN
jgi:hypothetical protein